jgi:hypothetical protein
VGPLLGARHYKRLAGIELSRAIGVFGGASVGGLLVTLMPDEAHPMLQPAALVAAATALGMTVMSIFQLARVMRHFGVAPREIVHHILYGPVISGLAVIGAVSVARSAAESFAVPPGTVGSIVELTIGLATFAGVTLLAFRTLAESTVRSVADILPAAYRPLYRRVMMLGPAAGA